MDHITEGVLTSQQLLYEQCSYANGILTSIFGEIVILCALFQYTVADIQHAVSHSRYTRQLFTATILGFYWNLIPFDE